MEEAKIVLDRKSFEALAADTRVKIMKCLLERRKTLSELAAELGMSVSGVKEHLSNLEGAGLIVKIDDGHKWKYYELTDKGSAIVAPKKSMRIMLLLSLSIVAFMASAFMLMASTVSHIPMPISAEPDPSVVALEKLEAKYTSGAMMEEADYAPTAGGAPAPEAEQRGETAAPGGANSLQSAMEAPEEPANDVPVFLAIAILSMGAMLVCLYELARK
ncbi:TPA: ArsR family transcriptional regulator [Candidatus Micrarchaeota archaeon]|nr:ArsR family transcriptional regulator [Candidatus Micrarchaeota archaeon]